MPIQDHFNAKDISRLKEDYESVKREYKLFTENSESAEGQQHLYNAALSLCRAFKSIKRHPFFRYGLPEFRNEFQAHSDAVRNIATDLGNLLAYEHEILCKFKFAKEDCTKIVSDVGKALTDFADNPDRNQFDLVETYFDEATLFICELAPAKMSEWTPIANQPKETTALHGHYVGIGVEVLGGAVAVVCDGVEMWTIPANVVNASLWGSITGGLIVMGKGLYSIVRFKRGRQ